MAFYDRTLETLDRNALAALQADKLARLASALEDNPFFAARLRAADVEAKDLRQPSDLVRLSYTTKIDLSEAQAAAPPFGDLLSFPRSRFCHLHRTSGTIGRPLFWLDTAEDWETWRCAWGHVYRGAGVDARDVVFCAFSFGPYIAHWTALAGAQAVGAVAISGGGMRSADRLRMMRDVGATVLVSTPTYALRLAEEAADEGFDIAGSAIRVTIHAGEPGASLPHVRRRIETLWGARCFDHAGATEVGAWSFSCEHQMLHLLESSFIFEVIDPATGNAVPDGERGELVITGLGRLGMPAVRYRTGDLVVRDRAPCVCGRTFARLVGGVLGRVDDMVIVRGVNVFPSAVDNVVRSVEGVVEYQLRILRGRSADRMCLTVEVGPPSNASEVCATLAARFRSRMDLAVDVEPAPAGSLPRFETKARRVVVEDSGYDTR